MNKYKLKLRDTLNKISVLKNLDINIEAPKDSNNGDFALPCFSFSKKLGKSPVEIAEDIMGSLKDNDDFYVSVAGPFLNFKIKESVLIGELLNYQENLNELKNIGKNEKILIEYSSPNTNKSQHVGHLRNNLLGVALSNIFKECGFNVITSCLFNDKGTAIAKTIWGYLKFGDNSQPNDVKPDKFVAEFYVKACQYEKEHPEVEKEFSEINRKWEDEDVNIRSTWRKLVDWVLAGYKETYKKLGCTFDYTYNESDIYKNGKEIALKAYNEGVLTEGDGGSVVTDLENYNLPDTIVIKSDGTSLYITQDIYLAKLRNETLHPNKTIYIVANEQNLHFKQLFALLDQLKIGKREDYFHLNYGYISLPTGRMKSREGTVVDADDLINEVINDAKSEEIGLGAIKFQFLKVDAFSDFIFDPIKSIELTGDTSVYIQYVYARIQSLLNKNKEEINLSKISEKSLPTLLRGGVELRFEKEEVNLMRELLSFNDSIIKVIETYSPSFLCKKLLDIANNYNSFYQKCRILDLEDENLKSFRLKLSEITSGVIKYGLCLLGIGTIDKM